MIDVVNKAMARRREKFTLSDNYRHENNSDEVILRLHRMCHEYRTHHTCSHAIVTISFHLWHNYNDSRTGFYGFDAIRDYHYH